MKSAPDRMRVVATEHADYWRALDLHHDLGGPFADRSGGLITFETGSVSEAERLVSEDPFAREGLLENRWVKEWAVE